MRHVRDWKPDKANSPAEAHFEKVFKRTKSYLDHSVDYPAEFRWVDALHELTAASHKMLDILPDGSQRDNLGFLSNMFLHVQLYLLGCEPADLPTCLKTPYVSKKQIIKPLNKPEVDPAIAIKRQLTQVSTLTDQVSPVEVDRLTLFLTVAPEANQKGEERTAATAGQNS